MFRVLCRGKTPNGVSCITEKFLKRIKNIKTEKIEQHWSNKCDKTETLQRQILDPQHLKLRFFLY